MHHYPRPGGVAAPSRKCCGGCETLKAQTEWSFGMRCFQTIPNTFRGLTTPSAPTLVAFGIIFLMARPPLLVQDFARRGIRPCSTQEGNPPSLWSGGTHGRYEESLRYSVGRRTCAPVDGSASAGATARAAATRAGPADPAELQ